MSGVVPRVIRRAGTSASSAFVSFEHKRRGNTRARAIAPISMDYLKLAVGSTLRENVKRGVWKR